MNTLSINITISSDGYGPEAEAQGAEYLDAVDGAYRAFVESEVQSLFPDATIDVSSGLESSVESSDDSVSIDLQTIWDEWCATGWTAWERIRTIEARAVNDLTREMMASGFDLTHEQATELGDEAMDWIRNRLGLTVTETDACVECRPHLAAEIEAEEADVDGEEVSS